MSPAEVRFAAPLVPARLIRRYQRFLADMALDSGATVTAHCPNPGSMMGLADPGLRCWLEPTPDPRRKLDFAWRLVELPGGHMAGIDATLPNRLVGRALREHQLPQLSGFDAMRAEVRYGAASRVDFLLTGPDGQTFVEVKNVHLRRSGNWAEFPDCVTARGARHLDELAGMVRAGQRAVLLYLVQRTDCARLRLAADLDPGYARAAAAARQAGVEFLAWGTHITPEAVTLADQLTVAPPVAE